MEQRGHFMFILARVHKQKRSQDITKFSEQRVESIPFHTYCEINMYFVVFIRGAREHCIVPSTWIKEIDSNWEKFVNKGVNTNQLFTIFYSDVRDAVDGQGKPNPEYAPIFSVELKIFPEEGCYSANILKFFANYEQAVVYRDKRRNINPPVYNTRRLTEQPIPSQSLDESNVAGEDPTATVPFDGVFLEEHEIEVAQPENSSFDDINAQTVEECGNAEPIEGKNSFSSLRLRTQIYRKPIYIFINFQLKRFFSKSMKLM